MKTTLAMVAALVLSGCAYQMQLMPRDSGKMYRGEINSDGFGGGTLSVQIDGRQCSGKFVTASSGDSFGLVQTYGGRSSSSGFFQSFGGSSTYKALMSCSDGTGLRCDVTGTSSSGGGICSDSNNRIYDLMYTS